MKRTERKPETGRVGVWKAAGFLLLAGALICTAVACAEKETQSQAEEVYCGGGVPCRELLHGYGGL